jgi:glutamate dehydrogenase (NADP+)
MSIKASHSGRLTDYKSDTCTYMEGAKPWAIDTPVDMAFPCATQHEVCLQDAQQLVQHGCKYLFEGANMPCTDRAVHHLEDNGVLFGPGKAANAGGVAVSGLEMVQNSVGLYWTREEVNAKLKEIMQAIYKTSKEAADAYNVSLASGSNIASFKKVAEAVLAQGAV